MARTLLSDKHYQKCGLPEINRDIANRTELLKEEERNKVRRGVEYKKESGIKFLQRGSGSTHDSYHYGNQDDSTESFVQDISSDTQSYLYDDNSKNAHEQSTESATILPLYETSTKTIKFCTNCGKEIKVGQKFCRYCGKKQR